MIKAVVLVVFFLMLLVPALSTQNVEVSLRLLPLTQPVTLRLSEVILLAAASGVAVAILVGLMDRVQLQNRHRKTLRELEQLQQEIRSLRDLATMERPSE